MIKAWIDNGILQCASEICDMKSCPRFSGCIELIEFTNNKQLKEENRQLKEEIERLNTSYKHKCCKLINMNQEIKQLKEALQECDAYAQDSYCDFCGNHKLQKHKEDCEYIKLTRESEDE